MVTQTRKPPTWPNHTTESPPKKNRGMWKKGILETIGALEIPFAFNAAKDQAAFGNDPSFVSPYALDLHAIEMHKEPLADAVMDLADNFPVLGVVLDRLSQSTPFAALATTAISLGLQIAENHGVLPETMHGISPSLIPRDDLAQHLKDESEMLREQQNVERREYDGATMRSTRPTSNNGNVTTEPTATRTPPTI